MTRQTRTLVILAAAVVVCGGLYGGLRVWNSQQEEPDDTIPITQMDNISALSFTNAQGELSFTKTEDTWQWDGDAAFPADQTQLDNLARQAGKLSALRTIEDPEGLDSYGLDTPSLRISVSDAQTGSVEILLGTVAEEFCYAKLADSDVIYTVDPALSESFQELELLDLAEIPEFPTLSTSSVTSVAWTSGDTALTITKTESEPAQEDEEGETAQSSTALWEVNGSSIPDGNSTLSSLIAQLSALDFDSCCDYQGQTDTLAACGLDTPTGTLTVSYGEEGEDFTLTLGALDGTGSFYYAQLSGDPAVYQLSADSVNIITALTAEQLTASAEE